MASTRHASSDWELAGRGAARASFAETTVGRKRVIEDLTVQAPITCANSPTPGIPVDVRVISARVPISSDGDFSAGAIKHGAGTSVRGQIRARRVTLRYRHVSRTPNEFDGTTEVCNTGSIALTGRPGHRASRPDKEWRGETLTSEPVARQLVAGGRALEEPPHTNTPLSVLQGSIPDAFDAVKYDNADHSKDEYIGTWMGGPLYKFGGSPGALATLDAPVTSSR